MILFNSILITLGTFFLMEGITWATHKYVMHGFFQKKIYGVDDGLHASTTKNRALHIYV